MTKPDESKAKAAGAARAEQAAKQDVAPKAAAAVQPPAPRRPGRFWRFVRSVFSHLIFAALVVGAAFGYFFHGKILRDVGDRICAENMLGQFMTKAAAPSVAAVTGGTVGSTGAPAATGSTGAPAAATVTPAVTPAATPKPPAVVVSTKEPTVTASASSAQPSTKAGTALSPPAAAAPAPVNEPGKTLVPESAGPARRQRPAALIRPAERAEISPMPRNGTTARGTGNRARPAPTPSRASVRSGDPALLASAWTTARQAYAAGRPGATDGYKKLIRQYPDVPGLTGELGNIYYRQGALSAAAEQFYETAMRLIRKNQEGAAACLLGVLKRIDSAKAAALGRQVTKPCSNRR